MAGSPEVPSNPEQSHKPEALLKLEAQWSQNKFVCVGLDSEYDKLPIEALRIGREGSHHSRSGAIAVFNREIIDATSDLACAYKPNLAFYEGEGIDGLEALEATVTILEEDLHGNVPIILDAKRADIGNTNRGYANFLFDKLGADAITVAPYLGSSMIKDGERKLGSLEPFLSEEDKLIFVLCRTSNEDAGEFQDLPIALDGLTNEYKAKFGDLRDLAEKIGSNVAPLYLVLAHKLARDWNKNGNIGLVVGATYPEEMSQIRKVVGDMPILMPGLGAQEGDAQAAIQGGIDSKKQGLVVNSSRGIIFASREAGFADAARKETEKLHNTINRFRQSA